MGSVGFEALQLEEVRARLRKMRGADLLRFGRAAASLCSPEDRFGQLPRRIAVDQPAEAREGWAPDDQVAFVV
jgi:hypothetical protein